MLFALWCTDKADHLQVRMDTRKVHLEWLDGLNAEGALKMAGPYLDDDGKPMGSLVIIDAASMDDAKAIADSDPYARAGLFDNVIIRPFNWVINNPDA